MRFFMAIYNHNFDDIENLAIDKLVARSADKRLPRINRKKRKSKLDTFFRFIHERKVQGKSLTQIRLALSNEHNLDVSKSRLCRFVDQKMDFCYE